MNLDANTRLQAIGNYVHDYMVKSYNKRSAKDKANLETYLLGPEYVWRSSGNLLPKMKMQIWNWSLPPACCMTLPGLILQQKKAANMGD